MTVADRPDALEIIASRGDRAKGRARHGLGYERDHPAGADFDDPVLERLRGPGRVVRFALALPLEAIGVAGVDVMGLDQERLELRPPPGVAAGRERAEGRAVIALAPGDDGAALRLAGLDEILARHFQRRLDSLRTAAGEIDVAHARWSVLDQAVGQALGGVGGEKG